MHFSYMEYSFSAVLDCMGSGIDNCWTGLVDWTGRLTLNLISMISNEIHSPVELHGAPQTSLNFRVGSKACNLMELFTMQSDGAVYHAD